MVEISEMERKRRKATRDADNKIPAMSFRLGKKHVERVKMVCRRRDISQSELVRELVDKEYERVTQR